MTHYEERLNQKPEVADRYRQLEVELARSDITLAEMDEVGAEMDKLRAENPECFPTAEENAAAEARIRRFPAAKTRTKRNS